jgi:hypothetical protein
MTTRSTSKEAKRLMRAAAWEAGKQYRERDDDETWVRYTDWPPKPKRPPHEHHPAR